MSSKQEFMDRSSSEQHIFPVPSPMVLTGLRRAAAEERRTELGIGLPIVRPAYAANQSKLGSARASKRSVRPGSDLAAHPRRSLCIVGKRER
jgi:hypothetical protein